MHQRLAFCLCILIGLTVNAQTINLRGTVANQAGSPIAGAIVTLVKQSLKDTTAADGMYSLTKNTSVVLPLLIPQKEGIFLENGVLAFSIPAPSPVKVEIFDVKGNLLKREVVRNVPTGFYRFIIGDNYGTSKLLVVKASSGHHEATFRYLPLSKGAYQMDKSGAGRSLSGDIKLTVMAAISDTLRTTASGYTTKSMVIASYDQSLDITLDTAGGGGAQPSVGCGKATTLQKNVDTRLSISAGGKNREYIIRIPADYDPNTPYKLWFSIHCMNGTAAGVAAGSAGTGYQYYGIWKFANPAGGKGTTVFCSPEGIGARWADASDLSFFRAMINKFENDLCIDKSRIFATGFSMGGSMSYALACAMPDTFRAVGMHEGGGMSGCDQSHRGPVPMFITVGTEDAWPNMGPPQIKDLAQRNGCDAMDIGTMVPGQINPPDQMHPVCVDYKNCDPGYPCRACVFKGGHNPSPGTQGAWGEGNTWVPDSTWSYFKRFY